MQVETRPMRSIGLAQIFAAAEVRLVFEQSLDGQWRGEVRDYRGSPVLYQRAGRAHRFETPYVSSQDEALRAIADMLTGHPRAVFPNPRRGWWDILRRRWVSYDLTNTKVTVVDEGCGGSDSEGWVQRTGSGLPSLVERLRPLAPVVPHILLAALFGRIALEFWAQIDAIGEIVAEKLATSSDSIEPTLGLPGKAGAVLLAGIFGGHALEQLSTAIRKLTAAVADELGANASSLHEQADPKGGAGSRAGR